MKEEDKASQPAVCTVLKSTVVSAEIGLGNKGRGDITQRGHWPTRQREGIGFLFVCVQWKIPAMPLFCYTFTITIQSRINCQFYGKVAKGKNVEIQCSREEGNKG